MTTVLISWLGEKAGILFMLGFAAIIGYFIVKWIFGTVSPGGRIAIVITLLFLIWALTIRQ